jgi:streptogramin lyase
MQISIIKLESGMKANSKFAPIILLILSLLILTACSSEPLKETASHEAIVEEASSHIESPSLTEITIDGLDDEWFDLPIVLEKSKSESTPGFLDIDVVKAFVNDKSLYALFDFVDQSSDFDHLQLVFQVDSKIMAIFWKLGEDFGYLGEVIEDKFNYIDQTSHSTFYKDKVFECKIALEDLGSPKDIQLLTVKVAGVLDGEQFFADEENVGALDILEKNDFLSRLSKASQSDLIAQSPEQENAQAQTMKTGDQDDNQQVCGSVPMKPDIGFQITDVDTEAELIWRAEFVPWWVRSSPDGRVLAVSDAGDSIYELKPDGSLGIAFQCPGVQIETFAAASDGALWFATRDGGRLYRVDISGEVRKLADYGNRNLEAGPNGEIYAMESGLVRIDPDGSQETISDQVKGRKFAVGPNGEIAAMKDGKVVLITDSGELIELASGYGPEQWLAFDADGLLYVTHWSSVDVIDLASGSVTPIPWLVGKNLGESGAFAPDGRLLLYHPNVHVYAADLTNETIDIYHQVNSNSYAMAASPAGDIYIAFGNNKLNGKTSIYQVVDARALELVLTVPYGEEHAMAFDGQGFGYIAVSDQATGGAVIRFDTTNETFDVYFQTQCHPTDLAIHPTTGQVWWADCGKYNAINENGNLVQINSVPGAGEAGLAITPDGSFYTIGFFDAPDQNTPMKRYLYHYDQSSTKWEEIADLSQSDPAITNATLTACPNGVIYTIESLDEDHLPVNHSSFNAVRRLETDGSLTLLGFDFSGDGQAASCNPANGHILFTSIGGIFSLTPP